MVDKVIGFDYILENLEIDSKLGEEYKKNIKFEEDVEKLNREFDKLEKTIKFLNQNRGVYEDLKRRIKELKDIRSSLNRLKNGYILDDIEFFEIKSFSLISQDIYKLLKGKAEFLSPEDLEDVIDILDPDGLKIASFYIYDSYSEELAEIRKKIKVLKDESLKEVETIYEDKIRKDLSNKILNKMEKIEKTIDRLGYLDFVLAKAKQSIEFGFVRPEFSNKTQLKKIYNPKLQDILNKKGKKYQKIDIEIDEAVNIITGANMSGKTVVLKTLGLIQKMAQTGFFVPAECGKIKVVDDLCISIGDAQSMEEGLSSFASEMLEIDQIIKKVKKGKKPLILIDELARTTNPQEGRALLKSVIDILEKYKVETVITTHYDKVGERVRKLRVKGLKKEEIGDNLTSKNIDEYIDYSLIEVNETAVPEEALTIAKLLNIDEEVLEGAYRYL